jgi:hypothetical protein
MGIDGPHFNVYINDDTTCDYIKYKRFSIILMLLRITILNVSHDSQELL